MSSEEVITFVRRCVRRQVEAAIYLPLRRNVIKLTFPYLQAQTAELQRAMTVLRDANPSLFLAHPMVREAKSYEAARRMFRDISRAYLPADQGQLLIRAAGTVLAVYSECRAMSGAVSVLVPDKKPVVARPDLLKSLIQPVPSETTSGQATGEKRSQSVPEFSSRTESLAESNPHTLLQIDTTPIKTPINSTTSTGIVIRSPKKAIFVVPRQPPENERLEAARSLSRHIDYTDEDLVLDPVATLFPSLDTEENLDGKFMRLADGARVTDLADSSLPACMHSPETKKNETTSVGDFDNAGITEVVAIDGMTATISPRLDEISILTARVYNAEESTNGVSNDTQKAPPLPSRLTQLQNTESEDRDDTPTRELKSILSDLSVQFNSVRLNTDGGGITSDDCYGIDTFDSVDNNDDDDDDNSTETSKRNDSFSDTWKTSVCITPGLPSPKSNVESSGAKNSGISTGTPAAVTGTNEERTESIPHQSAQTQAQSQAIAMSRVSIDSARGRPHLFDTESPKVCDIVL